MARGRRLGARPPGRRTRRRAELLGVAAAPVRPGEHAYCPAPSTPRPVEGLLVVDFSALWAGPLCAHLLGLAGARVVEVETPGRPDGGRRGKPGLLRPPAPRARIGRPRSHRPGRTPGPARPRRRGRHRHRSVAPPRTGRFRTRRRRRGRTRGGLGIDHRRGPAVQPYRFRRRHRRDRWSGRARIR